MTLDVSKIIRTIEDGESWFEMNSEQKAAAVVNAIHAVENFIPLTSAQLHAGMQKMPYWAQGPQNYIDFAMAFGSALEAKE